MKKKDNDFCHYNLSITKSCECLFWFITIFFNQKKINKDINKINFLNDDYDNYNKITKKQILVDQRILKIISNDYNKILNF